MISGYVNVNFLKKYNTFTCYKDDKKDNLKFMHQIRSLFYVATYGKSCVLKAF